MSSQAGSSKSKTSLPGEEGWDSSSSEGSSSDSSSSADDDDNEHFQEKPSNSPQEFPSQRRTVTVQRADIASTLGQEGNEELQDLNVDIYDQQTYEQGVFKQVDKAISDVGCNSTNRNTSNNNNNVSSKQANKITDLMQVIHAKQQELLDNQQPQGSQDGEQQADDEQVLQLTRLQRLNKVTIKQEKIDLAHVEPNLKSIRIPKLGQFKVEPKESLNCPTISTSLSENATNFVRVKQEKLEQRNPVSSLSDEDANESNQSDHKPGEDEENEADSDVNNDSDIEYETDDELDRGNLISESDDDSESRSEQKCAKLKDDGSIVAYKARIKAFNKAKSKLRLSNILEDGTEFKKLDEMVKVEGNLYIPKDMWDNIFEHQRIGVRWLWELHQLGTGGVLGDEMGLGKTIQMIAFLTALKTSNITSAHKGYEGLGPVVLVCPATVMHQWLIEFRKWWPPFRVAILHNTGAFGGDRKNLAEIINKSNGILIVSYPGAVIYQDYLHKFDWHYAILDEGHKIKNPDAQVTLACKRFRTPHRIILSGSPVQNNLRELWSIFDFIYPGKLGTLPVFMEQFATPITQGGYSNASDIQVQIAYKCACVLRDTIKPFLLRRTKAEVNSKLKLPDKSEQVLFCKLTDRQRILYETYLNSPTIRDIKAGFCQIFVGLIQLKKICNHPDLFDATECKNQMRQARNSAAGQKGLEFFSDQETFGHIKKSGKMMVVDALLKLWKKQGHKVLLFTQSRQMLKIFENYLTQNNYRYLVMDGTTSIGSRQTIIEQFNSNEEIFVFLLTTRVGGVGVNLIGANRIIIYDPDWNPSTDIQARERAWRIGQKRHVIIYRLLTAGTIEEKIYHRQVFKLYLTNRVLKNAKQKRFFKTNDLHELFTLGDNDKNIETNALFDDNLKIDQSTIDRSKKKKKKRSDKLAKKKKEKEKGKRNAKKLKLVDSQTETNETESNEPVLSEEKLRAMREKAKRLSQMIALQYGSIEPAASDDRARTAANQAAGDRIQPIRIKIEPGCGKSTYQISNANQKPLSVEIKTEFAPTDKSSLNFSDESKVVPSEPRESTSPKRDKRGKKKPEMDHLEYLVKQDVYKHGNSDKEERRESKRYKRDDYILERLFKSANVSGALKHDKIESDSTDDFKVVESEAEKVARDAINALRESRRSCIDSRMGVPNWTGRNGQLNSRPRLVPRNNHKIKFLTKLGGSGSNAGSSSVGCDLASSSSNGHREESLLSSIKKRNQINPISLNDSNRGPSLDEDEEEQNRDFLGKARGTGAQGMADKLREFLLFRSSRNGESQTDEILGFFKENFKSDKTAIFKALLYKMCEFQRRGDKGFWVLKREFKII